MHVFAGREALLSSGVDEGEVDGGGGDLALEISICSAATDYVPKEMGQTDTLMFFNKQVSQRIFRDSSEQEVGRMEI